MHQLIFNNKAPKFSKEVATDLLAVRKYFIEEWFTYIRVFGSTTDPRVLPLNISDKLLAREIARQAVEKGLTKLLKENKKLLCLSFPIRCGSFSLENFNHAIKESVSLESLRLHTFPKRRFDRDKIAYDITTTMNIKPYNHEANYFEDLLQLAESFEQSFEWARTNLSPEDFESFQEFKNKRLEIILLHVLKIKDKPTHSVIVNNEGPNSHIESQVYTGKVLDIGKAQDTKNTTESRRKSTKK